MNICGANSTCVNTEGTYSCGCEDGYEKIDGSCLGKIPFMRKLFLYTKLVFKEVRTTIPRYLQKDFIFPTPFALLFKLFVRQCSLVNNCDVYPLF